MISLRNLTKKFGQKIVLTDVSLDLSKKSTVYCLLGESGSGKTTLFNIFFGIDQTYEGNYFYNGQNAESFSAEQWDDIRTNDMRMVYQDFKLLEFLTVKQNIEYSVEYPLNDDEINKIMKVLDIENISDSLVKDISGGEKQRVAFARAVIANPTILLLDEPTDNLDDKNTALMLQYLEDFKQDRIIIIITHDKRVKEFSDYTFYIDNGEVLQEQQVLPHTDKKESKEFSEVIAKKSIKKLWSYTISTLRAKKHDLTLTNIPIIFVFALFIIGINFIRLHSVESLRTFFSGLSENVIVLNTSNFTSEYEHLMKEEGLVPTDDGVRIGFSDKDLEEVTLVEGVKSAALFNASTVNQYDLNHNKLNEYIGRNEYPDSLRSEAYFSSLPETLRFIFVSMNVPYDYSTLYNQKDITVLEGRFPEDESNEIMIPVFWNEVLLKGSNKDTLINSDLELKVSKDEKEFTHFYQVVGIYQPKRETVLSGVLPVYTGYVEDAFLDVMLTNDNCLARRNSLKELNIDNPEYSNPLYASYENYKQAVGTNLGDLIVELDSIGDAASVSQDLRRLFPNLKQLSQHDFKQGEFKDTYNQLSRFFYLITFVAISIVSIFILFINKSYIRKRNKEMAVLYSLGYSSASVKTIILFEYLFVTLVNILAAVLILLISYMIYFKSTNLVNVFLYASQIEQIASVVIFLALTTYISVIFALHGVKKKNLVASLKE